MLHEGLLVRSPVTYAELSIVFQGVAVIVSFIHPFTCSFIHSFIHSSIHSFIRLFIHPVLRCVGAVAMGKQVQADLTLELAPRRLSSCHFNDGAAHAPDVCLPAVARLLDDLWSHPVGRPLHALVPRVCRVQLESGIQQQGALCWACC